MLVDVRHPQTLSSRVGLGNAVRKEDAGGLRSVQLERLFGTLIAHSSQLCGARLSNDSNPVIYRP